MLTGDNAVVAERVAEELGIERFFAEVLPAEKAATVQRVRAEGKVVAMVGDGVNDAPALASADVGIAIGAGTDVAVATADVVLVRSNPDDIPTVIALARATYRQDGAEPGVGDRLQRDRDSARGRRLRWCGNRAQPGGRRRAHVGVDDHRRHQRTSVAREVVVEITRGTKAPCSQDREQGARFSLGADDPTCRSIRRTLGA